MKSEARSIKLVSKEVPREDSSAERCSRGELKSHREPERSLMEELKARRCPKRNFVLMKMQLLSTHISKT